MKKKHLTLAVGLILLASACGFEGGGSSQNDSMTPDSAVIDTATTSLDTTVMATDKLSTDSGAVHP